MADQIGLELTTSLADTDRLLAYMADLELEVDRLRRQGMFLERQVGAGLLEILGLCSVPNPDRAALAGGESTAHELLAILKDLRDSPGYHPAHDQVVAIAVRPLAEQVFRWQQRLSHAPGSSLRLELEVDHMEWFPTRLRHILDNLFANALRHRDPTSTDQWVSLALRPGGAATSSRSRTMGQTLLLGRTAVPSNCSTVPDRSDPRAWGPGSRWSECWSSRAAGP